MRWKISLMLLECTIFLFWLSISILSVCFSVPLLCVIASFFIYVFLDLFFPLWYLFVCFFAFEFVWLGIGFFACLFDLFTELNCCLLSSLCLFFLFL